MCYGVYLSQLTPSALQGGNQCSLAANTQCLFQTTAKSDALVIVDFFHPPQLEEQNRITLSLPESFVFNDAWIQGVNMYMGKSPVLIENEDPIFSAAQINLMFFLGACSEPNMRWQLVLNIKKVSDQRVETFYINFQTTVNDNLN